MKSPPAGSRGASARFDSLAQEAYLNLWRTYDRLKALEDELFNRHDLTAQQYNALRLLRAAHPQTIPTLTLATRLISRAPDITRLLDKLAERRLIWRERRADNRRVVEIGITDAGLALLAELSEEVRDCHERQVGHLPPERLGDLIDLLAEVRAPHEADGGVWSPAKEPSSPLVPHALPPHAPPPQAPPSKATPPSPAKKDKSTKKAKRASP